ncbi:MAG TPA: phytanoyl-CoA dioxygenase family protein [Rhizomicrobium sp.]|jgi:hypothetical protein
MIEYARLRPGPGFSPSKAMLYYAQRMASVHWLRQGIAGAIARGLARKHPAIPFDGNQIDLRDELLRRGLVSLPNLVAPDTVQKIHAYLQDKRLEIRGRRKLRLKDIPSDVGTADYPLDTVLGCPAVVDLVNSAAILSLVGAYLGCSPTLSSIGLRWSFPSTGEACDVQRFHRDPDDWRFVKLFVYLTDVDADSGPHIYVKGSHRTSHGARAHFYERDKLAARYGAASITSVTGSSGTAFIADTSGIHMGMPPKNRPRLMLVAQYSLLPVFAFNYQPVLLETGSHLDRYVNRLLFA